MTLHPCFHSSTKLVYRARLFPAGLEAVKRATYAAENVAPIVLFNPRLAR